MTGIVVVDDGTVLPIKRIELRDGKVSALIYWHDCLLTADHYRVIGEDGSHIWDALFQMDTTQRHMNSHNAASGWKVTVVLSISFLHVDMENPHAKTK